MSAFRLLLKRSKFLFLESSISRSFFDILDILMSEAIVYFARIDSNQILTEPTSDGVNTYMVVVEYNE